MNKSEIITEINLLKASPWPRKNALTQKTLELLIETLNAGGGGITSGEAATIANTQVNAQKGVINGITPLNALGKVDEIYLTSSGSQIQSDWNQTNNTSADFIKNKPTIPDISAISPQTIKLNSTTENGCVYSDAGETVIGIASGNIILQNSLCFVNSTQFNKYLNDNLQSIPYLNILANAGSAKALIQGGYIYASLQSSSTKLYRCLLSLNIADVSNWVELSVSGAALVDHLIGYGENKIWFGNSNSNCLSGYTISGNTITLAAAPSFSSFSPTLCRVNDNGLYVSFFSSPRIRLASFGGDLDSTKQVNSSISPTQRFCTKNGFYVVDESSITNNYIKIGF